QRLPNLSPDVEDVPVAALRFESGALGSVDLNFFEPAYRRGCVLVGSCAVGRGDWAQDLITVSREGTESHASDVGCDLSDTYRAELVDFLVAVARGTRPRVPALEGLAAVRLGEAIKQAAISGHRFRPEDQA